MEEVPGKIARRAEELGETEPAQEVTRLDCMNEVEHMSARVKRLEEAIGKAGTATYAGHNSGSAGLCAV